MKFASKYTFTFFVFLTIVYYTILILLIEPIQFRYKLQYSVLSLILLLSAYVIEFAFNKEAEMFKSRLFSVFLLGKFKQASLATKIYNLIFLSWIPFFAASVIEFILVNLFTDAGVITFGYPLPFYSFVSSSFLIINFFSDLIFFMLVTFFVGYTIAREHKNIS